MERRKLLPTLLIAASLEATQSEQLELFHKFTQQWIKFYRRINGCIEEGDMLCNPTFGQWDKKTFDRARELAKKVFQL